MIDFAKYIIKEAKKYHKWKLRQKKSRIRAVGGDNPDDWILVVNCPRCGGQFVLPAEKDASFELTQRKKLGEQVIDTGFPFLLFLAIFFAVSAIVIFAYPRIKGYISRHWASGRAVETAFMNSTINTQMPTEQQAQIQINGKLVRIQDKVFLVGKIINRGPSVDRKTLVVSFIDKNGKTVEKQRKAYPKISQGETPFEVETGNLNSVRCKTEIENE